MTRINCIPVKELTDKHLIAEYRELPRVFKLARVAEDAPLEYTMGKGHVLFFYNKLEFLCNRQFELTYEMIDRGFKPSFDPWDLKRKWEDAKPHLWHNWTPTPEAMEINRGRIRDRLNGNKST